MGYVGVVQSPVLQVWSPVDIQVIDWVAWPIPCFGPVHQGSQPLIPVGTHLSFMCGCPLRVSDVGAQATDRGVYPPRCFGPMHPGSCTADLDAH